MAGTPRIAIVGAGAVGCWFGGAWTAAGLPVRFIARKPRAAALAADGLRLTHHDGGEIRLAPDQLNVSDQFRDLGDADVIALCVKATDNEAVAKQIARHAAKGATVISFQNGVRNAERLAPRLPKQVLRSAMIPFNVARMGGGRVHKGTSGDAIVEGASETEALSKGIGDRPGRLLLASDMPPILWGKLLLNLNNAVNALSGKPLLAQLSERDYRRVLAAAMVETLAVLKAAGIMPAKIGPIVPELLPHAIAGPDFLFRNVMLRLMKIDAEARSSMADDLSAGRPTEIDYLNGEVVRLAAAHGLQAPVNAAIAALIRQAEAGVEHLWSAADLRARVLEGHKGAALFGY